MCLLSQFVIILMIADINTGFVLDWGVASDEQIVLSEVFFIEF